MYAVGNATRWLASRYRTPATWDAFVERPDSTPRECGSALMKASRRARSPRSFGRSNGPCNERLRRWTCGTPRDRASTRTDSQPSWTCAPGRRVGPHPSVRERQRPHGADPGQRRADALRYPAGHPVAPATQRRLWPRSSCGHEGRLATDGGRLSTHAGSVVHVSQVASWRRAVIGPSLLPRRPSSVHDLRLGARD